MPAPNNNRPVTTTAAVDFSGVESRKGGGRGLHVQPGDYLLELKAVEVKTKQGASSQYVSWQWKIVKGPEVKPGVIYHITSLKPEQLWNLKGLLEDLLGKEIPQKAAKIDFAKYIGRQIGATVTDDDPYTNDQGKTTIKSRIEYTYPASEYRDAGSKPTSKVADDSEDEDDETQDVDATESDDEDEDELETIDDDDI